jgi:tetratricopeptide (TPR) repeat protein
MLLLAGECMELVRVALAVFKGVVELTMPGGAVASELLGGWLSHRELEALSERVKQLGSAADDRRLREGAVEEAARVVAARLPVAVRQELARRINELAEMQDLAERARAAREALANAFDAIICRQDALALLREVVSPSNDESETECLLDLTHRLRLEQGGRGSNLHDGDVATLVPSYANQRERKLTNELLDAVQESQGPAAAPANEAIGYAVGVAVTSLLAAGRLDEAERAIRQALERSPSDARLHFKLYRTLAELHRLDEAFDAYAMAVGLDSTLAEFPVAEFQAQKILGRGATGVVFLAKERAEGREVAIKVLLRSPGGDERLRFIREAHVTGARIESPHVVRTLAWTPRFLVTEYLPGSRSLAVHAHVRRGAPGWPEELLRLTAAIARGLRDAHGVGVVHRDVKPQNVLVGSGGEVKICDFGLARALGDPQLTVTGLGAGTLFYAAPEQLADFKDADQRADVYGLGATVYFVITGRDVRLDLEHPAFAGLPASWREFVRKATAERRVERHLNMDEVLIALGCETRIPTPSPSVAQLEPAPTPVWYWPAYEDYPVPRTPGGLTTLEGTLDEDGVSLREFLREVGVTKREWEREKRRRGGLAPEFKKKLRRGMKGE